MGTAAFWQNVLAVCVDVCERYLSVNQKHSGPPLILFLCCRGGLIRGGTAVSRSTWLTFMIILDACKCLGMPCIVYIYTYSVNSHLESVHIVHIHLFYIVTTMLTDSAKVEIKVIFIEKLVLFIEYSHKIC